jgi:hypothetical protein
MKFDAIVMNPPYMKNVHLKFLKLALETSRCIVHLGPARWLLNAKNNRRQNNETELKKILETHVKSIKLINGNSYFEGVKFEMPLCIININMNFKYENINIDDELSNSTYQINDLNKLRIYSYYDGYENLRSKILTYCINKQNLADYENKSGNWYANFSVMRGHINKNKDNMHKDDFYTFISKDLKPSKKQRKAAHFAFDTEQETANFIEYLKTRFSRFCLSLFKINKSIGTGVLKSVPYLKDYTKKYTDADLYKMFNITKDEIEFIESVIPKYYE